MYARALSCLAFLGACQGAGAEPAPPRAADYRSEAVDERLEQASARVRTRGFSIEGEPVRGFLVHGGVETTAFSLRSGRCYVFVGVASGQVASLELTLFDSAGAELGRAAPGTSAFNHCPAQSGDYYLSVRASGAGLFALRRFQGPRGLDIRLDDLSTAGAP